ncbi:hypothetical protein [Halosimplex pelagicum]|uniref:Uncharacterized protein n=1 Tax=Halosimplex pelagicum TaxID=869886 RepID=A0A7D5PDS9_9EURY|nr:hypothetical protein [Halosimplex pelagicum]QLH84825.1 hypothetical protein HZS54_25765 [Halosimplex pelagicum]
MKEDQEKLLVGTGVVVIWFLLSRSLANWITDNYYLIESISLLLIFGLLYEVWTSTGGKEDFLDILIFIGDEFHRTWAQIGLLFGVTSLVYTSMIVRQAVEARFGPLAVVQLLAIIGIISRAFVNVRAEKDPWAILNGERDTYLVYAAGLLALVLSYVIRGTYSPFSTIHNAVVIFLSTLLPAAYLYVFAAGKDLPSLKDLFSMERRTR